MVGTDAIAPSVIETFSCDRWRVERIGCFGLDLVAAPSFALRCEASCGWRVDRLQDIATAREADMVSFATRAASPHVVPPHAFQPGQIILNISLRDLAPELLVAAGCRPS